MGEFKIIPFTGDEAPEAVPRITIHTANETLRGFMCALEQLIQGSSVSFGELFNLCFELVSSMPMPISVIGQSFVVRARYNQNGELFSKIDDLSYNKTRTELIRLGRFNLPGEGVFYASIPAGDKNADSVMTAICEVRKELFDMASQEDRSYFTISKWNVNKPFDAILLTQYLEASHRNTTVRSINNLYEGFLKQACSAKDNAKCQEFYRFISERAGRKLDNEKGYLLTTAFYHAVRAYYGNDIAIVYSSSMTDNCGLNIVLSPTLVDSGHLTFDGCIMYNCQRDPRNFKQYSVAPSSEYWHADDQGIIRRSGAIR